MMPALALGATLAALGLGALPLARTLEWSLYDLRMRLVVDPAGAPPRIAIVEIDEQTLRALEPVAGRWPWPRLFHAGLLDFLRRAPAAVVAYDVGFFERDTRTGFAVGGDTWTGADSDDALVEAVARSGNVVLLADGTYLGSADGRDAARATVPGVPGLRLEAPFDERPFVTPPFEALARAARGLGHNVFPLDVDGPLRRTLPFVRTPQGLVPSLSMAAYLAVAGHDAARVTIEEGALVAGAARLPIVETPVPRLAGEGGPPRVAAGLVRFRGPAVLADGKTPTYRTYSFGDLLLAEEQLRNGEAPRVDPAVFKDAIVIVGVSAAGLHDVFVTPLGSSGKITGAQVHAMVIDQLITGRSIAAAPAWVGPLVTLLAALAVAVATLALPMRWGGLATLALAGAVAGASVAWFRAGTWMPLLVPLAGIAIASVGGLAWQYFVEGRERRQVAQLFSRYVSKDVFEQVMADPALAELGGTRRTMSVLFSDVRGFTAITERGDPEALVAQLNEYFSRMVAVVFAHHGTVDKFVGDMVMALFGAPVADPEHADHAVAAALDMVAALEELNEKWAAEGRPTLGIGIGVNSGEMIAGNIGAETIRSYTVIGDAVNLGARLESLNKDYGTTIIVSGATAALLKTRRDLRPLGAVVVKGKTVPVDIFEVRAAPTGAARTPHAEPNPT